MRTRSQAFGIGMSRVLLIVFTLFASPVLSTRNAMAQDQAITQDRPQSSCQCWVDVKTGKKVRTIPYAGVNTGIAASLDAGVAILSIDGKTASNTRTKQNYALDVDGCWIDVKTLKRVRSVPYAGVNTGIAATLDAGVAILSPDGKTAYNTRTKQNYALEDCAPPTPKPKETTTTPTPSKPTPIFVRNYQPGEVFVGYMFLRAPGETAKNSNGFAVQMFYNFKPNLGIGGDLACAWGSGRLGTTIDVRLQRCTYTFGPQINTKPSAKVQFFFHPLVGGVHDANKTTAGTLISESSANALMLSIGGGINVHVNPRVEVRPIQVDYQPTHFGGFWQHNVRIATGIVFRFGKEKELPTW
jgi:hypothetical protein